MFYQSTYKASVIPEETCVINLHIKPQSHRIIQFLDRVIDDDLATNRQGLLRHPFAAFCCDCSETGGRAGGRLLAV